MIATRRRFVLFRSLSGWPIAMPAPRVSAVVAMVVANAAWGGSAVASKAALDGIPPMTLAVLRVAVAFVILRALLARTGGRPATGMGPALLGLTGVALFCATQNLGLNYATAGTTALLNGAIPVLTLVLAALFLGEQVTGWRLAGLLVSFTGIVMLVLTGSGSEAGAAAIGNLLPLVSALSFAGYAVMGRRYFNVGDALSIVAGSTRYGLFLLLPGAGIELITSDLGMPSAQDGLLVLYLGAGCSALAFVLCGYGLARMEAGHAATFGNLKPLIGIALAVILLHEPLTAGQLIGGALVLLGVIATTRRVSAPREGRRDAPMPPGGAASDGIGGRQ
jgi:drug/metabolite transporter (DMT)-like permease